MSALGPVSFGEKQELVFLGREISEQRNYSEKIAAKIDKEVSKFIEDAEKEACRILQKEKRTLDRIAKTLIAKETIEKEEFEKLIHPGKVDETNASSSPFANARVTEKPKSPSKVKKSVRVKIKRVPN